MYVRLCLCVVACRAGYLNDVFTIPANLAGLPAVTVPAALSADSGLPIGLQLIGPHHSEARLLDVADWIQQRAMHDGTRFQLHFDEQLLHDAAEAVRRTSAQRKSSAT